MACSALTIYVRVKANIGARGHYAETKAKLTSVDPVWSRVREEAFEMVAAEPLLGA